MIVQTKAGPHELSHAVLEAFRSIYPTADQEFARMTIWLESNKSRRPAKPESAMRFVNKWFAKVPKRHDVKYLSPKNAEQVRIIAELTGGGQQCVSTLQPVFVQNGAAGYQYWESLQ